MLLAPRRDRSLVRCRSLLPKAFSCLVLLLDHRGASHRSCSTLRTALMQQQSKRSGHENKHWFRNFSQLGESHEGSQANHHGGNVDEGALAEDDRGPGNGADCCRGYSLNKSLNLWVRRKSPIVGSRKHDNQKRGSKDSNCCGRATEKPGHQVSNECRGDDHWTRSDHGHGYGVQKLLFSQPVKPAHNSAVEERHDRQTTAKHKRS